MFWRVVKTVIFSGIAPLSVGFLIPRWLKQRFGAPNVFGGIPGLVVACVLLGCGVLLYCWCAWDFVSRGEGTPAPMDAPKKLVVSGPYRYVRNPMYVAVLCLIAAQVAEHLLKPLLIYFLAIFAAFHLFVLGYEEPHLRKVFGVPYEEYCQRVDRWLPRLRPPE